MGMTDFQFKAYLKSLLVQIEHAQEVSKEPNKPLNNLADQLKELISTPTK
jgi:hypothetical protein